jgi:hypothetical protein
METGILKGTRYKANLNFLAKKLRIKKESSNWEELQHLAEEAEQVGHPKAAYRVGYVEAKDVDHVVIDGLHFSSRILSVNLMQVHRVFFYLATSGVELEEWSHKQGDMLYQYWADAIKENALRMIHSTLNRYLSERYELGPASSMAPGSLEDWPITQQELLFQAMDGLSEDIGVKLSDSMLMTPVKTVSGIRFPSETRFESCQLCPRENCPGRRAKFDKDLFERKYS